MRLLLDAEIEAGEDKEDAQGEFGDLLAMMQQVHEVFVALPRHDSIGIHGETGAQHEEGEPDHSQQQERNRHVADGAAHHFPDRMVIHDPDDIHGAQDVGQGHRDQAQK